MRGDIGPQGDPGCQGPMGSRGNPGPAGPQGIAGPIGARGNTGPAGPQGDPGPEGSQGPQGIPGPTGPIGPEGPQGVQGPEGPQGARGCQGSEGPQGIQGDVGPTGATGPTGVDGATGTFSAAYGGRVQTSGASVLITADETIEVPLSNLMPADNVGYVDNSITISETGNYFINYKIYPDFDAPATFTFAVMVNGVELPNTINTVVVAASNYSINYDGSIVANLEAGDIVNIGIKSSADVTMSFDDGATQSLILFKLS